MSKIKGGSSMSTEAERAEYRKRQEIAFAALRRCSGDTWRAYTIEEINTEASRWTGVTEDCYGPLVHDERVVEMTRGVAGRTMFSLTHRYVETLGPVGE